ncbi:hypothetical protein K8O68_13825 [Salipaludibacillus sp. CUR1]|uniref:hypothetical protein n=1 Tax=Salipaludibacillus sp. CUR1 TaxID=2820003 RepID=UPI001E52650D|nr:hypothetical protein [Salipaludibacillus sp. CUR1]MCE7793500.1 hypothetical protein [Salipaludibacillus sp. CUR1]
MTNKREVLVRLDGKYKKVEKRNNFNETAAAKDSGKVQQKYEPLLSARQSDEKETKKIVNLQKKRQFLEDTQQPFWDDGKSHQSPKLPPTHRKKKNPSWDQFSFSFLKNIVFLSVTAAVLVGSAFGLMLLSLLSGNDTSAESEQEVSQSINQPAEIAGSSENDFRTFPSFDLQLVQGGAFSTEEKGQEMAGVIKAKGFPSVLMEDNGTYFLFLGIASGKESAEVIGSHLEAHNQDTYIKPYAFKTSEAEIEDSVYSVLSAGVHWMELAARMSVKNMEGQVPADQDVTAFFQSGAAWKQSHEALSTNNSDVEELLSQWLDLTEPVMEVYSAGTFSDAFAWEIQDSLLRGMIIYDKLIKEIENNNDIDHT